MRLWRVARWVLLVVWALALTMFVARGPEDTWTRDSSGAWVAHGHPAGPPPPADYEPPLYERAVPVVVLAVMALGMVLAAFLTGRSPTGRHALDQKIRYYGAVSVIATALAVSLALALVVGALSELDSMLSDPGVVVLCVVGAIVLLTVLSWHADGTRKLLEAHYDLKRATALLQETVERLAGDEHKAPPAAG